MIRRWRSVGVVAGLAVCAAVVGARQAGSHRTEQDLATADTELNRIYKQAQAFTGGSAQAAHLRASQRLWIQVRDETSAACRTGADPDRRALQAQTLLTRDRTAELRRLFLSGPESRLFDGEWGRVGDNVDTTGAFRLDLSQNGTELRGFHTALTPRATRIDETPDGDMPSIIGTVKGNVATVKFASGYNDDAGGTARITYRDGALEWQILTQHGTHYFPDHARLTRRPSTSPTTGQK